jgi:hypothetical protein
MGIFGGRPDPFGGLQPHDIRHARFPQGALEGGAVAIATVGHHGAEDDPCRQRRIHQRQADLGLGQKSRVLLALGQPFRRFIRLDVERVIEPFIGPETGHRHDPVIDLADRAQILAGDMGGFVPRFAVAGLVNDQGALLMRPGHGIGEQDRQPLLLDGFHAPVRFRKERLQPLDGGGLGWGDRFGAGERGQRLIAVPRQQQSLQVLAEGAPLGQDGEAGVKDSGVRFQGPRSRWGGQTRTHADTSTGSLPISRPTSTNYR